MDSISRNLEENKLNDYGTQTVSAVGLLENLDQEIPKQSYAFDFSELFTSLIFA